MTIVAGIKFVWTVKITCLMNKERPTQEQLNNVYSTKGIDMDNIQTIKRNIYEIDNAIIDILDNDIDLETGEVKPDISEQLDALQISKQALVQNVALYYKELSLFQESIKTEKKRLADMDSQIGNRLDKIKNYLSQNAEPIETPQFKISFRKSESIELDQNYLNDNLISDQELFLALEKTHPELIEMKRQLKKAEVKKLKVLPQGLVKEVHSNIQIK